MNANTLRRLNKLWKDRHTHDGEDLPGQITEIHTVIERVIESVGDGTGTDHYGTNVVFARDTSDVPDTQTHYRPDGTSDEVEVQAALDGLPAQGGELSFLDGEYFIDANILVPDIRNLRMVGKGAKLIFSNTAEIILTNMTGSDVGAGVEPGQFVFEGFEVTRTGTGTNNSIFDGQGSVRAKVFDNTFHDIEGGPIVNWGGLTPANLEVAVWGNTFRDLVMRHTGEGFTSNGIIGNRENPGRGVTGVVFGNVFENITKITPPLGTDYTLNIISSGSTDGHGLLLIGNVLNDIPGVDALSRREANVNDMHNMVDGVMDSGSHPGLVTQAELPALVVNQAPFHQGGDLSVGTGVFKLPFSTNGTILGVRAAVGTSPTGNSVIVDVNKNGTTIFTTQANRPTIPAGDADGVGAFAVPDVTSLVPGDFLTVDIDQVGSTLPGSNLVVVVQWRPTV